MENLTKPEMMESSGGQENSTGSVTQLRRLREKEERRRQILDAATRVFARDTYERASMDEIAREAQLSKGAIYLYFPSKRDLFMTLLDEDNNKINCLIEECISQNIDPVEKIKAFIKTVLDYFDENIEMMRIVMVEFRRIVSHDDELFQTITVHYQWRMSRMRKMIQEARIAGILRPIPDALVVSFLGGILRGLIFDRMEGTLEGEFKSSIQDIQEFFLRGILANPDHYFPHRG